MRVHPNRGGGWGLGMQVEHLKICLAAAQEYDIPDSSIWSIVV